MHFHRSLQFTLTTTLLFALTGCDEGAADLEANEAASVELAEVADEDAADRSIAPAYELSEVDGLHRFAPGAGPAAEVFEPEDAAPQFSSAELEPEQAGAPAWCQIGADCDWCDTPCGLPWPLGGMYIFYGKIRWENNTCVCRSTHVACEWVSGCAS